MSHLKKFIMGKNAIFEVLKKHPERIIKIYTSQKSTKDPLYQQIKDKKIPLTIVEKHKLSQMVASESHQSYVAKVQQAPFIAIKDFLKSFEETEKSLVVMLDSIYDPQNIGAIARACECFQVDLLIYSKNRGCDITPVTSKTSAGATELVPLARVSNLSETLKLFQKANYFSICADISKKSIPLYEFSFPEKTLLIMGSEGQGVQPLIKKKTDFHVSIPMLGQIDSLNVSQASAIFLNAYRQFFNS